MKYPALIILGLIVFTIGLCLFILCIPLLLFFMPFKWHNETAVKVAKINNGLKVDNNDLKFLKQTLLDLYKSNKDSKLIEHDTKEKEHSAHL
jgi:hypothetical protein